MNWESEKKSNKWLLFINDSNNYDICNLSIFLSAFETSAQYFTPQCRIWFFKLKTGVLHFKKDGCNVLSHKHLDNFYPANQWSPTLKPRSATGLEPFGIGPQEKKTLQFQFYFGKLVDSLHFRLILDACQVACSRVENVSVTFLKRWRRPLNWNL